MDGLRSYNLNLFISYHSYCELVHNLSQLEQLFCDLVNDPSWSTTGRNTSRVASSQPTPVPTQPSRPASRNTQTLQQPLSEFDPSAASSSEPTLGPSVAPRTAPSTPPPTERGIELMQYLLQITFIINSQSQK